MSSRARKKTTKRSRKNGSMIKTVAKEIADFTVEMAVNSPLRLITVIVAIGAILFAVARFATSPSKPKDGPDMEAVFAENPNIIERKMHARDFAHLCDGIADVIEWDMDRKGQDGAVLPPKLKTAVQLDNLRHASRDFFMKGWSFNLRYTSMGPTLKKFFDSELGENGLGGDGGLGGKIKPASSEVSPEAKRKWIDAMRKLARASEYVAS